MPESTPLVGIENLHKSYDEVVILKGVSLQVKEGDLVSIIGPSGCGKSTFLRCMNFLETPSAGKVCINGITIDCGEVGSTPPRDLQSRAHELRQHVGMVFQGFNLFPNRTILDNVTLAPRVVRGISRAEAEANAHRVLEKVGLGAFAIATPRKCPEASNSGPPSPAPSR